MATFITSRTTGQTININVITDTGYWKYNHDGTDSSVFTNGNQTVTITNVDGEFTIISCLLDGTPSGDITELDLSGNQITSIDLSLVGGLTYLNLTNNQLTSIDLSPIGGLTYLNLTNNQLTSIDLSPVGGLTYLDLNNNQLTSIDLSGVPTLDYLGLNNNQLTSIDLSSVTQLTGLSLGNNQLTSINLFPVGSLTSLDLSGNQLGSIDLSFVPSLNYLYLNNCQLTSIDLTPISFLIELDLRNNQLASIDLSVLTNLQYLYLSGNTSINTPVINDGILSFLAANELSNGWNLGNFWTTGGRTILSTTDYDYLINANWDLQGLDLISSPTKYLVDNINNPSSEQIIYGILTLPNLPTTDPNVLGQLWVDTANNNVLKVSQG